MRKLRHFKTPEPAHKKGHEVHLEKCTSGLLFSRDELPPEIMRICATTWLQQYLSHVLDGVFVSYIRAASAVR